MPRGKSKSKHVTARNQHFSPYIPLFRFLNELQDQLDSPEIAQLVEKIDKTEAAELSMLGAKARYRLHKILDSEEYKHQPIPLVAIADRFFQQRRALEGKAGSSQVNLFANIVVQAHQAPSIEEVIEVKAKEEEGKDE